MTQNKDPATYDIAKDILMEEIEHESWFLELLIRYDHQVTCAENIQANVLILKSIQDHSGRFSNFFNK